MVGILVALGLSIWFFRTAQSVGKHPWAWAAIALISYQIPVFLWGFVLRAVVPSLSIRVSSVAGAAALGLAVGLSAVAVGGLSAVLVYRHLLLPGSTVTSDAQDSGSEER